VYNKRVRESTSNNYIYLTYSEVFDFYAISLRYFYVIFIAVAILRVITTYFVSSTDWSSRFRNANHTILIIFVLFIFISYYFVLWPFNMYFVYTILLWFIFLCFSNLFRPHHLEHEYNESPPLFLTFVLFSRSFQ